MPATATTRTRQQLVNKAGGNLNVVTAGMSLAAEDGQVIDSYVDPMVLQLAADGIINLTADVAADAIPGEFFLPLAHCLADAAKAEFGRAADQGLLALRLEGERTLRRLVTGSPTYETLATDYY